MDGSQKVPVTVAARLLGITPAELRYRLFTDKGKPKEEQTYPIGVCKKSRSGRTNRCEIYRRPLQNFLELTDDEWEKEVSKCS